MQEITVYDTNNNSITDLVQWDKDVKINVKENELDKAYKVHYFNKNHNTAMVVESEYHDGILSAIVPNDILTEPHPIVGYIYVEKNGEHKSVYCFRIVVRKRPKPENYIYSDQKEYITFEKVLEEAEKFALSASESADLAKNSEKASKISEINAKDSEDNAKLSEQNSFVNADTATKKALEAHNSANSAEEFSLVSKSYAIGEGNIRENETVDNAKYYYEQVKTISQGLNGLIPMGTISFSQLSTVIAQSNYMYNISDSFVTDERFKDGAGYSYGVGTNVYRTGDGYWDCLAGTQVVGVKGDAESDYRIGLVNITKDDIGLGNVLNVNTNDQMPTFAQASTRENIASGEKLSIIFGKIMKFFSDLKSVAFSGSFNDLSDQPTIGNGTVTINQAGQQKGTFTMNQSDNITIELTDDDTVYSLPLATSETRGGVQIGYLQNEKNYPVQLLDEKMYVNVPWTNTWRGIQDNLESESTVDSLTANQGRVLNNLITELSGKSYADGYVLVDFGSLPNNNSKSVLFSLPDGVSNYWIEHAWTTNGSTVRTLPFISPTDNNNYADFFIGGRYAVIKTALDWRNYWAYIVIGYKK